MQVGMVNGSYVTILKNEKGAVIGYSLFTQAPINQLLQSMISRGYITSIISLPEKLLCSKNAVEEDAYILSVAVDPSYQKQGLGKKLIFSIESYCPAVKNIYLLTAASQTNIVIQKFYEYLGFERKGLFVTSDNNQKILYSLMLPNTTRFVCVDDSW